MPRLVIEHDRKKKKYKVKKWKEKKTNGKALSTLSKTKKIVCY